jgi:cytidine deaminase
MSVNTNNINDLPKDIIPLFEEAKRVAFFAYNIYSNYYVGAAVKTTSGNVYLGTFMENASYGMTICAEPAAILNANTNGDFNIESIVVVGGDNKTVGLPTTPCGRCRQIIYEASKRINKDIIIYCSNLELNQFLITTISELLPFAFFREVKDV